MKFSVFILGALFLIAVTARPREKHAGYIQNSSKQILHTAEFGGTYNFAKKHEGNTHSSISDHGKYEVYEPEEYGEGSIADPTYGGEGGRKPDGHSKGKQYYGHYGNGAQWEFSKEHEEDEHRDRVGSVHGTYGKGTYGHGGSGYKKESGEIHGYVESGTHDDNDEKYEHHTSRGKEENRGSGYYVTEKHDEHDARVTSNIGEYKTDESKHSDGSKVFNEHKISSGKREGIGEYTTGKHEDDKHGDKLSSSIGEYGTHRTQDHNDHQRDHGDEGNKERRENGGLGDFVSGTYDVRRYEVRDRSESGNDQGKYGGGWLKSDERRPEGGNKGYEVKEFEGH